MTRDPLLSNWRNRLSVFLRRGDGERGIAATEFALVLPVMLLLLTGMLIYGTAIEINRKVTITTRDLADLVAQYTTLTHADMTTLMDSAAQVMYPFPLTTATILVVEINVPATGNPTVMWSESLTNGNINDPDPNYPAYPAGKVVPIPPNLVQSTGTGQCPPTPTATSPGTGGCVIWAHVEYVYTPTIGYQVTGPFTLSDDLYMTPRQSLAVYIDQPATSPAGTSM